MEKLLFYIFDLFVTQAQNAKQFFAPERLDECSLNHPTIFDNVRGGQTNKFKWHYMQHINMTSEAKMHWGLLGEKLLFDKSSLNVIFGTGWCQF